MLRAPASALPGCDEARRHCRQGIDCRSDDGLERGATEVEAIHQRRDRRDYGQPLRMSPDVHGSRMATAGENHQAPSAHLDHQRRGR